MKALLLETSPYTLYIYTVCPLCGITHGVSPIWYNIYSWCVAPTFLAAQHTTVCLDIEKTTNIPDIATRVSTPPTFPYTIMFTQIILI